MAHYKETEKEQGLFLPINLEDQIHPGTFEWTAGYIIDRSSLYEEKYNNDEMGACAYPPKLLLKVILFSYSRGILSSRKIERACKENIITKALAENLEPDHATIAEFISENNECVLSDNTNREKD